MEVFLAAAGGTWFAIFMLLIVVAGITSSEFDNFFGGIATLVVGLLGANFIFGYPIISSIIANPLLILLALVLYVLAGSVYTGIWKWPDYIRSKSENIEYRYSVWKMDRVKNNESTSFEDFIESNEYTYNFAASNNKERITTWVMMWPFSMTWEVSRKPAIWAFNASYKMFGTMFERIGKNTAMKMHKNKK
jgi:hypothetical protein